MPNLSEGDAIAYRIEGEQVVLTAEDGVGDVFALFEDWNSEADRRAYRNL